MKNGRKNVTSEFSSHNRAIKKTAEGKLCIKLARNILSGGEDALRCVEDAFLSIGNSTGGEWHSLTFAKAVREHALKKSFSNSESGVPRELSRVLSELEDSLPSSRMLDMPFKDRTREQILDAFLSSLSKKSRKIFMRRYWYISPTDGIAKDLLTSEAKVARHFRASGRS